MAEKRKITGLRLPANVTFTNGQGSLTVGAHFTTGFTLSGIIKGIEQEGEHIVATFDNGGLLLLYGSGMYAEVPPPAPRKEAAK